MSARLYIEEIASQAGIDGSRRDQLLPPLQKRLNDLIIAGQADGLSPKAAEAAAIAQLGPAEKVAQGLGSRWNGVWITMEAAVMGVLTYFVAVSSIARINKPPPEITHTHIIIFAIVVGIIATVMRLWNRIIVTNRTFEVHRLMRRKLTIPFESISSVQMERGRLFGEHRIQVNYAEKKNIVIPSSHRSFRILAAALQTYVLQTLDQPVSDFFNGLETQPATVKTWKKVALTISYLIAGGLMASMAEVVWDNAGFVFLFVGGLLFAALTASSGIYLTRSRVKRILFIIISIVYFWLFQLAVSGVMFHVSTRILLWLALTTLPLAILLIWWRMRNRFIPFALTIVWLGAMYGAARMLPYSTSGSSNSLGAAHLFAETTLWMDDATNGNLPPVFCLGFSSKKTTSTTSKHTPYRFAIINKGDVIERDLPAGNWQLLGRVGPGQLLLSNKTDVAYTTESLVQYYTIDTTGTLAPDVPANGTMPFLTDYLLSEAVLSPDKNLIVAATEGDTNLVIVHRDTRTSTTYPQFKASAAWKWADSHTLKLLQSGYDKALKQSTDNITKWTLDTNTGTTTKTGTINIGPGAQLFGWRFPNYTFALSDTAFGIVDLDNGTSTPLPHVDEDSPIDWNNSLNQLTYFSDATTNTELIIAGPKGVVWKKEFDPRRKFAWAKQSPNGDEVFLFSKNERQWMFPSGRLEVWNPEQDNLTTIGWEPWVYTILHFISRPGLTARIDKVQWTPDGKQILWPAGHYFSKTKEAGTSLELVEKYND